MLIDTLYVVNHWLLLGLTTVGLGIPLAVAAVRRRPWLRDPGEVYRRVAPVVRIQVVLVYLFAFLAKLDTDFLNPALSCAAQMSQDLLEDMPLSLYASWQDVPAIGVTLLIEAFLPVGLLIRRTRVATIVVGGTFHTALGVAGHIPFSGILPEEMRIFDLQDAPVRIVSSNDERLARAARDGTRLVEYDLRHHLSENPDTDVVYSRGGRMVRVSGTAQEPAVSSPSLIERKLLLFRDIPAEQLNTCRSRRDISGPQQGS